MDLDFSDGQSLILFRALIVFIIVIVCYWYGSLVVFILTIASLLIFYWFNFHTGKKEDKSLHSSRQRKRKVVPNRQPESAYLSANTMYSPFRDSSTAKRSNPQSNSMPGVYGQPNFSPILASSANMGNLSLAGSSPISQSLPRVRRRPSTYVFCFWITKTFNF